MEFFRRIFGRKRERKPRPLRVEGCDTAMTPWPDDAELAAQALLDSMTSPEEGVERRRAAGRKPSGSGGEEAHDAGYYRRLGEKIRAARKDERRLTVRYLAYCEEQLALPGGPEAGKAGEMERELYRRQDVAEREGGELLRRWQRCLAECIIRQMGTDGTVTDSTDDQA